MPVTIDIREDIRYQQGIEQAKLDTAFKMLKIGIDMSLVQNIAGLEISKLEELHKSIKPQ